MNESYSYAFSFTSIRIQNWEAGKGGVQQGGIAAHSCLHEKRSKRRRPPVAPLHLRHTADDLSCSFSLCSIAFKALIPHTLNSHLRTSTFLCGLCVRFADRTRALER